jgi:hypothetical protein
MLKHLILLKKKLLNYDEINRLDFENINKRIISKTYIIEVNNYLNNLFKTMQSSYRFNNKTTKIFLLSYIILFHKESVNNRKDNYAEKMSIESKKMIYSFEDLYKYDFQLKYFKKFNENLLQYFDFFQKWKKRDGLILIRPMLKACYNIEEYIKIDTLSSEKLKECNRELKRIKSNIFIIAKDEGMKYYEKRQLPIFTDEKIYKDTQDVVHKAFWDIFEENLDKNNNEQILLLLNYIISIIKELVLSEKYINDFEKNINIGEIKKIINEIKIEDIQIYIHYLINKIRELQSPSEDNNTDIFLKNITDMIDINEKKSTILRYFFEKFFQKLEKIKFQILYLKKKI